ncbi:MAG: universal stress protein [Novosphingobium sp.]|nr:universal stress protein [Novosphingobium sp.]
MFRRIVVAYESSGASEGALRRGAELARVCQSELHLLGIVVTSGGLLLDPAYVPDELIEAERCFLLEKLEDTARVFAHAGIHAKTAIRDGLPTAEITAYIKEIKADLVVIGHSRKGGLARWLEGSVGLNLLESMPCSLLVAGERVPALVDG